MGGKQAQRKRNRSQVTGATARRRPDRIGPMGGRRAKPSSKQRNGKTPAAIQAEILAKMALGFPRTLAARSAGIDPRTAERWRSGDDEFAKACDLAEAEATDQVENALFRAACVDLNVTAQQVWLYNRSPDRWKDKRALSLQHTLEPDDAATLTERIGETLRDLIREARRTAEATGDNAEQEDEPVIPTPDDPVEAPPSAQPLPPWAAVAPAEDTSDPKEPS